MKMRTTKLLLLLSLIITIGVINTSCVSKKKYNAEVSTANANAATAANYEALNKQLNAALSKDQALINSQQIQITQMQNQLKVTLVNSVVFGEGSATLSTAGKATLASIAPTLSKLSGQQIVVEGFTDNLPLEGELKAKYTNNLGLSSARADNVANYLTSKGVPQNIISAQGFGEENPVAPNDNAADRAKNRRVEIIIKAAN
jgi:chemotaxis protein MotB